MTVVHLSPGDFHAARVEGLKRLPFERGLFQGAGSVESPAIEALAPFDNLVGSFNAEVPRGAAVELQVQVLAGSWSSWYRLGRWEAWGGRSLGAQEDTLGSVDVDTLKLKRKASAFRYRVLLEGSRRARPRLTRVSVTYLDCSAPAAATGPFAPGPWVRELQVPPRSQLEERVRFKRSLCSPTSLSMVLEYWGRRRSTLSVVRLVEDAGSKGEFGNWTLNVATAASLGLHGQVVRMDGFGELEREIASGRPVIVSVGFKEGELSGSPLRRTEGHLLVVSGFTTQGDLIVRDPIAPTRRAARRVYRRSDMAKVWLERKKGLAYALGPAFPAELRAAVPQAELRRKPAEPRSPDPHDPLRASQLLYGEPVTALRAKGDWVLVEAREQARRAGRSWTGYRGWARAEALAAPHAPWEPNAFVRVKRAQPRPLTAQAGPLPTLPMGARLLVESVSGEKARVRLLDGGRGELEAAALRLPGSPPPSGERILSAAEQFLGDSYVWGGLSAAHARELPGVDCSGLAHASYLSEGMLLPRDAQEQFERAVPLKRSQLRPGDLVFLSAPKRREVVNHVMLYAGGDALLESRQAAGRVLRASFQERFGAPLSSIESGDAVTDLSGAKPERRTVYFGGYLPR